MKGLSKHRSGVWHYKRTVKVHPALAAIPGLYRKKIRGSTFETSEPAAEVVFLLLIQKTKDELINGPERNWSLNEAIPKYLATRKGDKAYREGERFCERLSAHLGQVPLRLISYGGEGVGHPGVQALIDERIEAGNSPGSINKHLQVLRYILRKAATKWRDEVNRAWIDSPGFIEMLDDEQVGGYPMTAGEERELLKRLPEDKRVACVVGFQTGLRESYLRGLRWDQEMQIPSLNTSVFNVGNKNGIPHRVVLNSIAKEAIESRRGHHPEYVFTFPARRRSGSGLFEAGGLDGERKPYTSSFANEAFRQAVIDAGMVNVRGPGLNARFHDIRHSFASRLAAMDVPEHTIKDLMGHARGKNNVTARYTAKETTRLLEAAEQLVEWYQSGPDLFVHENVGRQYIRAV